MAGPKLKQGLDYFPMATRNDSRYKVIRALHGDTGYVILNTLLQDIHGEKGYFAKWNERLAKIFSHENGFQFKTTVAVVRDCFSEGIFDEELFHAHQILTSEEIQQVWINVAKERKEILYNPEYLLIDISPYLKDKKEQGANASEQTESPDQFPEEFLTDYREEEPPVNSNNPPLNSNNPADNKQGKEGKEGKEAKQAKEADQAKEESKQSEAFDFSHSAEIFFHLEKPGEFFNEKTAEKKTEENSGDPPESSAKKNSRNREGKQENLFEKSLNSGIPPAAKPGNSASAPNQETGKKDKSPKRKPHPVRPQIISIWEKRFGQPYENSLDGNVAINKIIRHLEKLIRRAREGDIIQDGEVHQRIAELWKVLLSNWDKLEKFYRNLIQFESIAKYLTEIINQIKDYGINQKQSKSAGTNGAKPSFDRFRK